MLAHPVRVHKLQAIKFRGGVIMKVIVKKWGNSAAVHIPASIMAAAHIALDQAVDVREELGRIIIEPVRCKTYKLDDLLDGITEKNMHAVIDTGAPVGREVW
jgi:antitoxin MazE